MEAINQFFANAENIQIIFYIVSPIVTLLAVWTAYFAIYRQSKPFVLVYYEISADVATVIDLVICNHGSGAARNIKFSKAIPIGCFGISSAGAVDKGRFLNLEIPVLAPGKELRYQAGQFAGLKSQIGDGLELSAAYKFRAPFRNNKVGQDVSLLDIEYMGRMNSKNSAAQDLSDALKGRNNTTLSKIDRSLHEISKSLTIIASNSSHVSAVADLDDD